MSFCVNHPPPVYYIMINLARSCTDSVIWLLKSTNNIILVCILWYSKIIFSVERLSILTVPIIRPVKVCNIYTGMYPPEMFKTSACSSFIHWYDVYNIIYKYFFRSY